MEHRAGALTLTSGARRQSVCPEIETLCDPWTVDGATGVLGVSVAYRAEAEFSRPIGSVTRRRRLIMASTAPATG